MVGPVPASRAAHLESLLLEAPQHHLLALGLLAERGSASFRACVHDGELTGVAYVGRDGTVVPAAIKRPSAARELGAALRDTPVRTVIGERTAVAGVLAGLKAPPSPARDVRLHAVTANDMGPWVTPALRPAVDADLPELVAQTRAYLAEYDLPDPDQGVEAQVRERVAAGRVYVLIHEDAIAFRADVAAQSRHGAHIEYAYTPPVFRRLGFASQGMGQLARSLLARLPCLTVCASDDDPGAVEVVRRVGFGPALPWRRVDLRPVAAEADPAA